MLSPKVELPNDLLEGLYRPEYRPVIENLNEAKFDPAAILEQVEKEIESKIQEARVRIASERPKPLTLAESEAFDRQVETLRAEIARTRSRLSSFKDYIDLQAKPEGGNEIGFSVDVDKKLALKRAVKALFGKKVDTVTYSMYLEAKKAKKAIEDRESDEYVAATWEE